MRATRGNVLIAVEKTMIDKIGLIYQDVRFNKHDKMVITGEVVIAPEFNNNEILAEVYEGMPRRSARSKKVRASDFKCTIRPGDKAYFHYLTLEHSENFIQYKEGKQLFKMNSTDIFCVVRDGVILMNLNYVLGQPYWDPELEDLGDGTKGKTKDIGGGKRIVTEIAMKPDVDMAWIRHIGSGVYNQRSVERGDMVLLTPNCEFENDIEGQKYWVFKHEDIIAFKKGDFVVPVNEWALVQTDQLFESALDHKKSSMGFSGVIVALGDKPALSMKRGDRVIFSHRDIRIMMSNLILMNTTNIQCHEPAETLS